MKKKWSSLSVLWRWRILASALLLFFVVAYRFNIKKTISLIADYKAMKQTADTIPPVQVIEAQLQKLTREQKANEQDTTTRQPLLQYLASYEQDSSVSISELYQTYTKQEKYTIETNKILLRGQYGQLLKLVWGMETNKVAAISAAFWELSKDKEQNKYYLQVTLYIKRIVYENKI